MTLRRKLAEKFAGNIKQPYSVEEFNKIIAFEAGFVKALKLTHDYIEKVYYKPNIKNAILHIGKEEV